MIREETASPTTNHQSSIINDQLHGVIVSRIAQFSTERLDARRVCWADLEDALRLHADRQIASTLSADGGPLSEDTTRRMLRKAILHWRTHGFGLWMFHRRDTGELIGRGGLIRHNGVDLDGHQEVGLAYLVLSDHWGQGYATEMGQASLAAGFEQLGLETIGGWTLPTNLASQRVLTKLGLHYEKDIVFVGRPHRFFRLDRRDYMRSQQAQIRSSIINPKGQDLQPPGAVHRARSLDTEPHLL